ncbi:MAG: MFS transporter [Acidobacteriota bacterium]|nr:MFS transporter [Acidobacteriota bacterium]
MSIVVVVKKGGKAVIAADSLYSHGSTIIKAEYLANRTKIHKFGESLVGVVGATAHESVLNHLFEKHKSKLSFSSEKNIFQTYLRMHPILKEEYFLNTSEGNEGDEYESSQIDALIANPNGIFGIYTWREVYEFEKFWALGSGRDYALGSLFSVYDSIDEPEKIAEIAVKAACEFDDGCGLPLTLHSVIIDTAKPQTAKNIKGKQKI